MGMGKFLDPKSDIVFKRIFGTEKHKDILIHFLNDIMLRNVPIRDVTFLATHLNPELESKPSSIVDVMCEDENGNKFVIEMQIAREKYFDKRALYYAAKAYCNQKRKTKSYGELNDVYLLAITDFLPFPNKEEWISHVGLRDLVTGEHDIKSLQLFFLQLPLFQKTKEDLPNMTLREKWAYFFKYADQTDQIDLKEIIGSDSVIAKAYDVLDRFSWTEEELRCYDSYEMGIASFEAVKEASFDDGKEEGLEEGIQKGLEEGLQKGLEEGRAEGQKKSQIEIAKKLLIDGCSLTMVAKCTGLTSEEVDKIVKSLPLIADK